MADNFQVNAVGGATTLATKDVTGTGVHAGKIMPVDATNAALTGNPFPVAALDTTNKVQVLSATSIHKGDNQTLSSSGNALLTAGVAAVQNSSGNADNQRGYIGDLAPTTGMTSGVTMLQQSLGIVTSSGNYAASPAAALVIAVASTAIFTVNSSVVLDPNTVSQETQVITAVNLNTSVTVARTNFAHNGSVTPFLLESVILNAERDASGEGDAPPSQGRGAATAVEQEFDGINYLRGRNVFGMGFQATTSVSNVAAGSLVVITLAAAALASIPLNTAVTLDPGTANAEICQLFAIAGSTITLRSTRFAHNGSTTPFNVYIASQNLTAPPLNFPAFGVAADAAVVYSGLDANNSPKYSIERDGASVGYTSGGATATPVLSNLNSNGLAGIGADLEIGVALTAPQVFANLQLVTDQHGQGGEDLVTVGGRVTAAVAAAAAAAVIKANPGRLCRVLVTSSGTAQLNFVDAATAGQAAAGTVIGLVPASAAIGSSYDLQMPAVLGIWAASGAGTPAVTVSYY